ncbi:MAG: aspartyl protease family protein [Verrucomicrobiales bacterium]
MAAALSCGSLERSRQQRTMNRVIGGVPPMGDVIPRSAVAVPLMRDTRHSVPVVLASVNGGPAFPLVLDTGGNHTMISARRANASSIGTIFGTGHITTAFGNRERSQLAVAKQLQLGRLSLHGVPLLIHHFQSTGPLEGLGADLNVLGTPAMSAFSYITFDYQAQRVTFAFQGRFRPLRSDALRLPMQVEPDGHLSVKISLAKRPLRAIVDTGYDGVLLLSPGRVQKLGFGTAARKGMSVRAIGPGASTEGQVFLLPGMELGGRFFPHVEAWTGGIEDSVLIGSGLLRFFRATFDFQRMVLWLEPREG